MAPPNCVLRAYGKGLEKPTRNTCGWPEQATVVTLGLRGKKREWLTELGAVWKAMPPGAGALGRRMQPCFGRSFAGSFERNTHLKLTPLPSCDLLSTSCGSKTQLEAKTRPRKAMVTVHSGLSPWTRNRVLEGRRTGLQDKQKI